jgi:hypothetical protein
MKIAIDKFEYKFVPYFAKRENVLLIAMKIETNVKSIINENIFIINIIHILKYSLFIILNNSDVTVFM